MEHQIHPIPPLFDAESEILVLGSFPSVASRAGQFFYHHPQNRFWRVLAAVLGEPVPETIEEKSAMLHRSHIALWDSIASCDIEGSSDSSIRNVVPNDLSVILNAAPIRRVVCNGALSWKMYEKYCRPMTGLPALQLPSTSPANAAWSLDRLIEAWNVILEP
jgi:hypoxanthine-DNA glycosylase